jgi:phosphate transport system permease protein
MLWASATLAVLVLPTVIVSTFEALRAVPESHRRAAYALGASQWQMVAKTVVPQARAGILTGAIFAVSRAIGETAPVLFIGCALFLPGLPSADLCILGICIPMINPFSEFMYLSYHLFILSTQSPNPSAMHSLQYGTALVLLVMTVALNSIAIYFRYRFRKTIGS